MYRNIILLSVCQALYMSVVAIVMTTSPLIGQLLAGHNAAATVPIGMLDISILLTAYLASMMMNKAGRQKGLMMGVAIGIIGAIIVIISLSAKSFVLFCIGSMGLGSFFAFGQYYRFAATEMSGNLNTSKAISYVLAGGLAAAFIGPTLSKMTRDSFTIDYAGNYVAVIFLCLLSIVVLSKIDPQQKQQITKEKSSSADSNNNLIVNPWFIVAVLAALVSYGVMALLMSATPLAMDAKQHGFVNTANVMQWHFVGMFAPAFFTGNLIKKYGVMTIMLSGGLVIVLSSFAGLAGTTVSHFILSLLLLGIGWNFMFISASTLLADCFTEGEKKARAQGLNETFVSATMIIAAISAGVIHEFYGWYVINVISIVIVSFSLIMVGLIFFLNRRNSISNFVL